MARKDFVKRNEGFTCKNCRAHNAPAKKSERNHCSACLFSLHIDLETPGDRKSNCLGLMELVALDYRGNKGFMILHQCMKCRKEMWNRVAEDDDIEECQRLNGKSQNYM